MRPARASLLAIPLSLFLSACAPYADFTLPAPQPEGPSAYRWEALPEPVITRDDAADVLNPSVVLFQDQEARYWNLYSEFDGQAWHTAAAKYPLVADDVTADAAEPPELPWEKEGRILSPEGDEGSYIAANGSALVHGDELYYWYQITGPAESVDASRALPPRIALARISEDSTVTRQGAPVLEPGPIGSFDEMGVADPYVIEANGTFYMYYLGQDRARRQRIGLARSTDGIRWEKLRSNPVLGFGPGLQVGRPGSFDEHGLGEPAVWSSGGWWWMLYTGRAANEQRRIGLARSRDGVAWERVADFPPIQGAEPWDAQVVCDPSVVVLGDGRVSVWFGGGDVASPDENLNGQIGVGYLVEALN